MSTSSHKLASSAGQPRPPSGAAEPAGGERAAAAALILTEPEPGSLGPTVLGDRVRTDVPASMPNRAMLAGTASLRAHKPILKAVRTGRTGTGSGCAMAAMGRARADAHRAARSGAATSERTTAFAPRLAATDDSCVMRVIAGTGGGQGLLLATAALGVRHDTGPGP